MIIVAEIAAGTWIYCNKDKFDDIMRSSVKHTVQDEYSVIPTRTLAFDAIQKNLECCGASGPNDWAASKYNNVDKTNPLNLQISKYNPVYKIPESCCKQDIDKATCDASRSMGIGASINPLINTEVVMREFLIFLS